MIINRLSIVSIIPESALEFGGFFFGGGSGSSDNVKPVSNQANFRSYSCQFLPVFEKK
jgi:hypothetical protein